MIHGEVLKDDQGRARLFSTSCEAVEACAREVEARLTTPTTAYAVGLPYGIKESEYRAYLDLLKEQGIAINEKPRVQDMFGRKWVHVWDTREEAEQKVSASAVWSTLLRWGQNLTSE